MLKPEEIEQIVAPIALYSDALLAQVFMASTYPLEVVEADRWAQQHKDLKGDALAKELEGQRWDDSVKALVVTPTVLSMMSSQLDWTQKLGDAVLAQQKDVMDAVQRLRGKAVEQKTLQTNEQQNVTTEVQDNGTQVVVVESAQPDTMYVPHYDPSTAYGAWSNPSYPPYSYPPPAGYYPGGALMSGLAFGAGVALVGGLWDDDMDWGGGDINVNKNVNVGSGDRVSNRTGERGSGSRWSHNPEHRHGVQYKDRGTQERFSRDTARRESSRTSLRESTGSRDAFRGRGELSPASGGNLGARASQADRSRATTARAGQQRASKASTAGRTSRSASSARSNAFSGMGSGQATRSASSRGHASLASSRGSASPASGSRSAGARSSGSRSAGGGGRGGGGGGRGRR